MFQCERCGACCRAIGRSVIYRHLDCGDGTCSHLDKDTNDCKIYHDRPIICRVEDAYLAGLFDKMNISEREFYEMNRKICNALKKAELLRRIFVSDMKEKLVAEFKDIFGYAWNAEDAYEPRLLNAKERICQGKYRTSEIIEIVDTSINSNGKEGLVLTVDSVCVKDSGNSTSKFIAKYADIDYTYINEDSFLGVDITALELNMKYGVTYKISITKIDRDDLRAFIDCAKNLYQEDEKLEW